MTHDEATGRRVVSARSGGVCETCGHDRATDWHHRLNRSQGGSWAPSNGLAVCRRCHRYITTHPAHAYARGWLVAHGYDPAATPVRYPTEFGEADVLLRDDGGLDLVDGDRRG